VDPSTGTVFGKNADTRGFNFTDISVASLISLPNSGFENSNAVFAIAVSLICLDVTIGRTASRVDGEEGSATRGSGRRRPLSYSGSG